MKTAFYKHWKKLALVITGVFWASCGDDTSCASPIATNTESSSSVEVSNSGEAAKSSEAESFSSSEAAPASEAKNSSSSEAAPASEAKSSSSSETAQSSEVESSSSSEAAKSSEVESSSSKTLVSSSTDSENLVACVDTILERPYSNVKGVVCADNKEFTLTEECPLYGTNSTCSYYYEGNGKIYSKKDFHNIYKIVEELPKSSSSETSTTSSSYSEKITCTKASLKRVKGLPCDGEICPDYGVVYIEDDGLKCDDGVEYEIESVCAKYGVDIPCKNTYQGNNGKTYNEEEFKKIYEITNSEINSSNSNLKSSSSFTEIAPKYGIVIDRESK